MYYDYVYCCTSSVVALHWCSFACLATPFHFTGTLDLSEARSTSKPVFDLKASLARPITWKLHTGKLKPMDTLYMAHGKGAEHSATKPTAPSRMDIFKSAVNRTRVTYSRYRVVCTYMSLC